MKNNYTTIGEFIEWARINKWTLRNIDELSRSFVYGNNGRKKYGWSGILATSFFFISDKQIKKELPERTEKDWQAYGR